MLNYPKVDLDNDYLISRYDGNVIDAKPWGFGIYETEKFEGNSKFLNSLLNIEVIN